MPLARWEQAELMEERMDTSEPPGVLAGEVAKEVAREGVGDPLATEFAAWLEQEERKIMEVTHPIVLIVPRVDTTRGHI